MKINKLISIVLLTALTGFSTQSFASLVSMDAEGFVTEFTYFTDTDPFSGVVQIGDAFSSSSRLETETVNDVHHLSEVGVYRWEDQKNLIWHQLLKLFMLIKTQWS